MSKRKERLRNRIIYIITEGSKTEPKYIKNFATRNAGFCFDFINSSNTDVLGMVEHFKGYIRKTGKSFNYNNGDRVFCFFDFDSTSSVNLKKAVSISKKEKYDLILSNPLAELWFLLHFQEINFSKISSKDVLNRLKQHFPKYQKNMDIFPEIDFSRQKAIGRAKNLLNYHQKNQNYIYSESGNPCTEMCKFLESLGI